MESRLPDLERRDLEAHLDACERCSELVALAVGASELAPEPMRSGIPEHIGRYRIASVLGRGAMGVVLEGSDPTLGRKVAIKLLQPSVVPADGEWTLAAADAPIRNAASSGVGMRVLREARTLARLAHPGIVEIYEVGVAPSGPFIVMELVRGDTLRAWMDRAERRWPEIVAMFGQAARALAAAHAAGVVHRDFKPDNAIVGRDGCLKVLDFGLARAPTIDDSIGTLAIRASDLVSTETGAIVGTPVYLAPECLDGHTADARSDQYAFFVSLFEGLVGHRPFQATDLRALVGAMREGPTAALLAELAVPAWLRSAIARGLASRPDDRFADMQAVVSVLERGMRRGSRRGRFIAAAIGSTAIGGVVWAASGEAPCSRGSDRIESAWSSIKRVQVASAFEALDAAWAEDTSRSVTADLDAYAKRWVDAYGDACRGSDEADLDRHMACLSTRRDALRATSDLLVDGERRTLERGAELVASLPAIEACAEAEPIGDPHFDAERAVLAKARALIVSGDYTEAERIATDVLSSARASGSSLLEVDALTVQASALIDKGALEDASRSYEAAFFLAERIDANALALEAAGGNALVVGWYLRDPDRGMEWLRHANAAARRFEPTPRQRFTLENRTALVLDSASRFSEALDHHQAALQWADANPIDTARTRMNLGMTLMELGRTDEGVAELRAALDLYINAFGDRHPETQSARVNLAAHLSSVNEFDEALLLFEAVHEVVESSEDVWPSLRLTLFVNWGTAAARAGRLEEGIARLEEAAELAVRLYGESHTETFEARANLAVALEDHGEYPRALAILVRLRADMDAGVQSPALGHVIDLNEAVVLRKLGRHDEAFAAAHSARAWGKRIAPHGVEVVDSWIEIARILDAMGRTHEAEALRASLEPSR
jgi:serine/threonine protein kinase/tetratricopeptide (TPR) repeat protein